MIKLKPLILEVRPFYENLNIQNGTGLKNAVDMFVKHLVAQKIIGSYHRNLTSGDMQTKDFTEDLAHKILSSISDWMQTVNNRGDWENQEGGMIKEVACKGCGNKYDPSTINEVAMGIVRCPNCNRKMDQEGNVYGG
jgi:hypothetical protein